MLERKVINSDWDRPPEADWLVSEAMAAETHDVHCSGL